MRRYHGENGVFLPSQDSGARLGPSSEVSGRGRGQQGWVWV